MREAHRAGLTDQQRQAVHARDVSVLLSSGAGCGKTHVLTERYLSHLRDDGAEVGQVVAITFTERAARQMRGRIRQAVLTHLRAADTDDEAERWTRHLRGLETAPISTIHSFCGTLLRQFAVEAGLDPSFDVLEDVLSANLEREAITDCLQKLLTSQTEAGEDLRQLVLLFGWRAVNEAVPELMRAWDGRGWKRWLDTPADAVAAQWREHGRNVLLPRYLDYVLGARPKIANCLELLRCHPPQPGPMAENVRVLLDELPALPRASDPARTVERLAEAAKVGRQGAKAWPDPDVYERIKQAFEDFRKDIRSLKLDCFNADPAALPAAVEVGRRFLRVASAARQTYHELKQVHGVVDFQDLLTLARDLLRDREDVRARLQDRYRFVLIDELQDTDPVQIQLVESLCGGGMTAGKLFAVGDHGQSIYRFRGADVHLFRGLRESIPHAGRLALTTNFRSQPAILDFTNALVGHRLTQYEPLTAYHTQVNPGPCVEFLWTACADADSAAQKRVREAQGIARRIAAMVGGETLVVERTPLTPNPSPQRGEGGNFSPLSPRGRGVGGEGERLRPVRRGDVVLLFRSMSNVHIYEAALRAQGLDYYLVGGRAFFAQQEIYDLLNLLRALENPQDEVSLAGTLRSPFCCLSDEALFVLRVRNAECGMRNEDTSLIPHSALRIPHFKVGLWTGLHDDRVLERLPEDQRDRLLRARQSLGRWRSLKDRLPIARLLGEVFADCGYDAATQFEFLGDRKLANLWKLTDLARTFDRSGLFGLAEFIDRLGELVKTQPREEQAATQPESADVVRLMSIHQAKGLEFPVVIIPDLDASTGGTHLPAAHWDTRLGCVVRPPADEKEPPFPEYGRTLWELNEKIEDWHESLRIFYVACTRAQDYLILSSAMAPPLDAGMPACRHPGMPAGFRPSSTWMLTLAERFDLFSGACRVAEAPPEKAPKVRVTRGEELADATVAASAPPCLPEEVAPDRIVPIPLRRQGQQTFTVAELEARLAGVGAFAWQFDAEDGSDRREWPTRRERTDPGGIRSREERLFRRVWQWWDCPAAQGGDAAEVGRLFERFTASDVAASLATARTCHRELEFATEWPGEPLPPGLPARPLVRGVIDCLWRDARDDWHLLSLSLDPFGTSAGGEHGRRRAPGPLTVRPGLVFAAYAVHGMLGAWPASVSVHSLPDGLTLRGRVTRAGARGVVRSFREALVEGMMER